MTAEGVDGLFAVAVAGSGAVELGFEGADYSVVVGFVADVVGVVVGVVGVLSRFGIPDGVIDWIRCLLLA